MLPVVMYDQYAHALPTGNDLPCGGSTILQHIYKEMSSLAAPCVSTDRRQVAPFSLSWLVGFACESALW